MSFIRIQNILSILTKISKNQNDFDHNSTEHSIAQKTYNFMLNLIEINEKNSENEVNIE